MSKIAIIILHFGDPEITLDCLKSLTNVKTQNTVDIYIKDNQGTFNAVKIPKHCSVIPYSKNLGFAGGNNEVVKKIRSLPYDYYLFLNNDTTVYSNFLDYLISAINADEMVGISGPVIEHSVNGKTYYDYGGDINWIKTQPKHVNYTEYNAIPDHIIRDFVSGCCLCIKSSLFHQLDGFDESYFMYLEDVDLCVRAKKSGYTVICAPKARIYHLGSKSASENFKIKQSLINSIRFTLTHTPFRYKPISLLFNLVFYPSLWVRWKTKKANNRFAVIRTRAFINRVSKR